MTQLERYLKRFATFDHLNDSDLNSIAKITHMKELKDKTHLFYHKEPMTSMYFMIHGTVKVYRVDENGNEQIVNYFQGGEIFPHHGLFRNDPYPANAVVVNEATVLMIYKEDFEILLHQNSDIAIKMIYYLGGKILELHHRLEKKLLATTDKQLISILNHLIKTNGTEISPGLFRIDISLTKQELGNMVGMTRETVSRNISKFKKQGILKEEEGYIIVDYARLEEFLLYT